MIDYENGMIYKLCCKDPAIKDCYVGSTCNFRSRKHKHKSRCNNSTDKFHNINVYKFIRAHGGWTNFNMVLVEAVKCKNKLELHRIERRWIEKLEATLNCSIPCRTRKEYRSAHKEQIREYKRKYHNTHKDKINAYKRKYYKQNKEKRREYYQKNKVKINCPHCNKEMLKQSLNRHIKKSCKEIEKIKLKL